ncbi:hypothetical protein Rs2_32609 [Raphanus sativus]|uniref:Uncharacterized protein LOC108814519 n=1 Tax=Raphanus sativus TaxID=3726 RepID=A0A6J0K3U7_RAPSA|nr:uncharacterized protein LOC108814519 [Raphanus sativus]KAJ4882516.1 hypothetical protein Rs2_32609 [Raphanus sativus]
MEEDPHKAKAAMEKTNLDGAPGLAHHNQTFSSATNTGEKRKREGVVSDERESGNSCETEQVVLVGDTKAIKDFGFGGGEESQRSVSSKRRAFGVQSNINLKGSLEKKEAREEPERANQDSTFNDFDKLREESKFDVGQTWALYDYNVDGMPRLYAQITKVSVPGFCLTVTWLEPDPDDKEKIQGYEKGLPVSVGRFKLGKTEDIKDRGRFSHLVQCSEGSSAGTFSVYPKEGETWAIFKAHITSLSSYFNHDWSAHPDSHCKYNHGFVEILSKGDDYRRVPIGFLHKAKGFSGVFCRFNKEVDKSYIKSGCTMQFSHRVPSFKTTGLEAEGVPRRGAYELDPAALPENIKEIDVPLHLLEEPTPTVSNSEEENDNTHSPCVYFASKGITFQTGHVWSFCSGDDNFPRHYGKIQKITFVQAFEQDPVIKLHVGRLKARPNKGVIQWSDKEMPTGCGNFRAKKILEIVTDLDVFSRQISLDSSGDGNDYSILPKTGDVWAIYRNWSSDIEVVDLKSQTYDLVEVLDDKLDYRVLLLAPVGGSANSAGFGSVYVAATEHWIDNADVRFTIPKCEMLRFSHQVTTSRVTKEVHGTWHEVYEPAIEAFPGLSCAVSVGEKRKRNEHGEDFDGLKFNDFEKLREEVNFSVGQTWALYDDDKVDGMPRLYARIRKVSAPSFGLRITFLEPDPDDEKQILWLEQDLPVSAGQFKLGKHHNTKDRSIFSHVVHCMEGSNTGHLTVSPRKGETWALFKNWDINWSSEPASHRSYEYEFVEILSDYADKAGVSVAYLHKAKGYASVFFRSRADIFRILPHRLYRFSHSVPSFKLTGTEGVPKDAYELDQEALPKTIQEITMPSDSETQRKPKAIYFASEGKVFQTGQFWSFYSGDDESPRYYCKIQKVCCTQVLNQEPSFKLQISRLKTAIPFPEDVIDWKQGKMPRGCGTYYPRTVLETITPRELSQQVMPQTSMDGKEYIILPKVGEVWITYRYWSSDIEVDDDLDGLGYDIVEVLDDTLDYKVVLLERQSCYGEDKKFGYKWFSPGTKYKYKEQGGSMPIFTIPKSERLRFSHSVHASRITREIHGELKDLFKVDSRPLPYFLSGD